VTTTTSMHDVAGARAARLDTGTVNLAVTDDGGNVVNLFVRTTEQASALIRAALAARDLLPEPPASHGENHVDNAGHATLACSPRCEPGTCITCGAHVSSDGTVAMAAAS
jgi:hypothetical protein